MKRWREFEIRKRRLIEWGTADQSRVNHPILRSLGYSVEAFIDDAADRPSPVKPIPVYHGETGLRAFWADPDPNDFGFGIAIGTCMGGSA